MPSVGLLAAKRTMELSWEGQVASPVPVEAYLQESGKRQQGLPLGILACLTSHLKVSSRPLGKISRKYEGLIASYVASPAL